LQHDGCISGGSFLSINEYGEAEWERSKHRHLKGSYDKRMAVWSEGPDFIGFEGSPAKWFQGHNVFGTDDLIGLACETLREICLMLGIKPTDEERQRWAMGDFQVRRADVTYSRQLASSTEVQAWIKAAENTAVMAYRGRGTLTKRGTLYFGK